ncbi:MAG TPA: CPBP family intramembrane glutamic endopeptidase [Edaphobacter sp.]|nr:CPBP family intramembrane glutamic endopeptidase [Edaphobacter sp.]
MSDLTPNTSSSVRPFSSEEPAVTVPVFRPPISPEDQTLFFPNAEGTPPPEPPVRIPHLGHAALFLAITGVFLLLIQLILLGVGHPPAVGGKATDGMSTKFLVGSEALSYLATLVVSWFIFPLFWKRPFAEGIQANLDAARRNALRLIPMGIILSISVQAITSLVSLPKKVPMNDYFRTPSDVWLVAAFGTLLAPLFEEVAFRGFLLPAFAIAYDWLSLPRTPAAHEQWHLSNKLTRPSLVFSAVLTSILFALIHGFQTAFTWPVLVLLFCVSLVLSYVRLRLRSVMASTLIHVSYNATLFVILFIVTGGFRHLDKIAH